MRRVMTVGWRSHICFGLLLLGVGAPFDDQSQKSTNRAAESEQWSSLRGEGYDRECQISLDYLLSKAAKGTEESGSKV